MAHHLRQLLTRARCVGDHAIGYSLGHTSSLLEAPEASLPFLRGARETHLQSSPSRTGSATESMMAQCTHPSLSSFWDQQVARSCGFCLVRWLRRRIDAMLRCLIFDERVLSHLIDTLTATFQSVTPLVGSSPLCPKVLKAAHL